MSKITKWREQAIIHLVGPGSGEFVRKPLAGGGEFVNFSRSGLSRSFFNISLKNMPNWIALYISIKNIFNNFALKRYVICVVFTPSLPYTTVFFAFVYEIACRHRDVISSHMEEKQLMYRLKSSVLRKDTFFVLEWLRQKGLEKLCEIFES